MLSERLYKLVSEPSGSSCWKYQDPPLERFHLEHCDYFVRESHFTHHISASLWWYQICWITGLGYCIIYFALIKVLVWSFPSCIGTPCFFFFFCSSWSLPLECNPPWTASYILWHVQIGLFPKPKVCICLFFFF